MRNATTFPGWMTRAIFGLMSLAMLALVAPANLQAQEEQNGLEECAGGTLFYLTMPDTVDNTQDARFTSGRLGDPQDAVLLIYSAVDQQVRIGRAGGNGQPESVTGGEILEYDLSKLSIPSNTTINTPSREVVKIESDFPIVVYGYRSNHFGVSAFTAIPVESWGQQYFAATWPGWYIRNVYPAGETDYNAEEKKPAGAEIIILAAYDNTQVTIAQTGPLVNCNGCGTVTLMAGQSYMVQSAVDTNDQVENQPDIAGTMITANKRIGVMTGNTRTQLEDFAFPTLAGNSAKDQVIEFLAPIEQHGTEFVFMPTMDEIRQRGVDFERERSAEFVRVYPTTESGTEIVWFDKAGQRTPISENPGPYEPSEFAQERIGSLDDAVYFTSSDASQAYQSPKSHAYFRGTTGWGNFIGAAYDTWGTYMVEMVPKEQWTSFAPFRAPSVPASTLHYLNVVTDTNSRFLVSYRQGGSPPTIFPFRAAPIPGTDLIWGSVTVTAGTTYTVEADSGATFSGFVYGNNGGYELYRPGAAKDDDDDDKRAGVAGGGDGGAPSILHPSEYEELISEMYGYPLAPSRCVLGDPDEYDVTVEQDCFEMRVTIKARNSNPLGLRFVRLVQNETVNARIDWEEPTNPLELKERKISEVRFVVTAIDPLKDARAVVEFRDRSREGEVQRVSYSYEAERVVLDPADELDFGKLTLNESSGEREVTLTNPLTRDLVVKRLGLVFGNQRFNIVRTEPMTDWEDENDELTLAPGESMKVFLEITPIEEITYRDSLEIELGCIRVTLPLIAASVQPCLLVSDLNFGTLGTGVSKTLDLELCNIGDGTVRFVDSSANGGGAFLTWLRQEFSVAPEDITLLEQTELGPNECVTIQVTFMSTEDGSYRTVGRFWASTRECRDTSIWTARVVKPGPIIEPYDWAERWVSSRNPCTKNGVETYSAQVPISNLDEAAFEITNLRVVNDPDGVYSLNVGTLINQRVLKDQVFNVDVFFTPLEEKDYGAAYGAAVRMNYRIPSTGAIDSLDADLWGIGIESYVEITDADFGREEFTTPGATNVVRPITITSTGTRDVTINGISIGGQDVADFGNITVVSPAGATIPTLTLAPGEEAIVNVTFDPRDADPLFKEATIDLVGDFAYDDCSVTDSSGALTAEVFTLGASIDSYDFGTILTCYEGTGFLTVTNTSTDSVLVTNVAAATPTGQFLSVEPTFTLDQPNGTKLAPAGQPGSSMQIPVRYQPGAAGAHAATVEVTIMDITGTQTITTLVGQLSGAAEIITIELAIDEYPSRFPGLPLNDVAVNITGEDPSRANISDFRFTVQYDEGMMRLINNPRLGSLFPATDGWQLEEIERAPGYVSVRIFNQSGAVVSGTGEALLLDFITFIGETTESVLDPNGMILNIYGQNDNECVVITYNPGQTVVDSVCGLDFRLIEAANARYAISEAQPSIVKSRTEVAFSIGLEGHTTLEVFDRSGNIVGLLVDQDLTPGGYVVTWDASGVSSGKYFIRATSGPWTETLEVIVQK